MAEGAYRAQGATKEQIRAKLDVASVVGAYVQLRRSGKRLVGLCPFHQEKTPSFSVDPEQGLYYCFGCKEGGDIFDFVMKLEGMSFSEALSLLAEKAGVELAPVTERSSPESRQRNDLLAVNRVAQSFFRRSLRGMGGRDARRYLVQRGVSPQVAEVFGIGYAPDSWDGLARVVSDLGCVRAAIAAGVVSERHSEGVYDRFRNRIMFPLINQTGRVIGFGGRALGSEEPKYLNSPETAIYAKRRYLFGIHQAKAGMRRQKRAIVVEGYFDCVMLHQYGIDYAVASCGTSLTADHLKVMGRLADDVYLCFDADAAGRKAVLASLESLRRQRASVHVVVLPEGHDPDSFVREAGVDAFLGELERALPLVDFLLEEALGQADLSSVSGRVKGARATLPILKQIESPVEQEAYIRRVATRLGLSARSLAAEVGGGTHAGDSRHTKPRNRNTSRDSAYTRQAEVTLGPRAYLERETLRCLLDEPSAAQTVIEALGEAPFRSRSYNEVLRLLADGVVGAELVEKLDPTAASHVTGLLLEQGSSSLTWQDCLQRMRLESFRAELESMEVGLATLVDHNPEQYMVQMGSSLLAFRRWCKALQEQFPRPTRAS